MRECGVTGLVNRFLVLHVCNEDFSTVNLIPPLFVFISMAWSALSWTTAVHLRSRPGPTLIGSAAGGVVSQSDWWK